MERTFEEVNAIVEAEEAQDSAVVKMMKDGVSPRVIARVATMQLMSEFMDDAELEQFEAMLEEDY